MLGENSANNFGERNISWNKGWANLVVFLTCYRIILNRYYIKKR
jgi:hypothetical protein